MAVGRCFRSQVFGTEGLILGASSKKLRSCSRRTHIVRAKARTYLEAGDCDAGLSGGESLKGKEELEDSPTASSVLTAADTQTAVMAIHDLTAHPETKAGSADAFGGEEGGIEIVDDGGADADAGIGDGDEDAFGADAPLSSFAAADHESTAETGHGVNGVTDEVGKDLPDLALKTDDGLAHAFTALDGDAGIDELGLVEVKHGIEQVGGADGEGVAGLLVKAQGLRGDLRSPVEFVLCLTNVGVGLRQIVGLAREIEEVGNGFKGIINLVRDGSGKASDGGELLAFAQS